MKSNKDPSLISVVSATIGPESLSTMPSPKPTKLQTITLRKTSARFRRTNTKPSQRPWTVSSVSRWKNRAFLSMTVIVKSYSLSPTSHLQCGTSSAKPLRYTSSVAWELGSREEQRMRCAKKGTIVITSSCWNRRICERRKNNNTRKKSSAECILKKAKTSKFFTMSLKLGALTRQRKLRHRTSFKRTRKRLPCSSSCIKRSKFCSRSIAWRSRLAARIKVKKLQISWGLWPTLSCGSEVMVVLRKYTLRSRQELRNLWTFIMDLECRSLAQTSAWTSCSTLSGR